MGKRLSVNLALVADRDKSLDFLTTIRQKPNRWTRRAFGLLVVVWLNIALQPCVMAFGDVNNHGCPGCPPPSAEDISSYSAHDAGNSNLDATMCASSTADCELVDDFNFSGRATSVSTKDAPIDIPVGIAPPVDTISLVNDLSARPDVSNTFYLPGDSLPLRVLYCSYLI